MARDLIIGAEQRRGVPGPVRGEVRRHVRTALLLRRLAAHLDPEPDAAPRPTRAPRHPHDRGVRLGRPLSP